MEFNSWPQVMEHYGIPSMSRLRNRFYVSVRYTSEGNFDKIVVLEHSRDFVPKKRTALDGKVWWCAWNPSTGDWSKCTYHGKYKTRWECQWAIDKYAYA